MVIWKKPGHTWPYVIESERELPEAEQTRWILQALDADAAAYVQDKMLSARGRTGGQSVEVEDLEMSMRSGAVMLQTLRLGLVGVENLHDENGQLVEMPKEHRHLADRKRAVPTRAFLDGIPAEVRNELAGEIDDRNTLTNDDQGN